MKAPAILRLILCMALCEAVGAAGAVFTAPAIPGWYAGLRKPAFTPPSWIFAPMWTALYLLMGIALFLIWNRRAQAGARAALAWFGVQLLLNALWSPLFFGLRSPGLGLAVIVPLWAAIAMTGWKFRALSRGAGFLLLPYLVWVGFAAALNFAIWRLNP